MTELDDHELLAQYARAGSETAFAALVARYVSLVYSVSLRFTGNPHHAQEITQAVFIILARKAGGLRRGTVLSGWLYQTARLTAANFVKGEIRRQRREQEAYMQSTLVGADSAAWAQIAPLLDEAMGRLGETDRNAIVLRFFENKTAQEVAAKLKLNEAAAHKRVSRALERLRKFFSKRGVTLSATVIAGAVAANAVQAAPAGLAVMVKAGSLAAAGTGTITFLKFMSMSKLKLGIGALVAAGATTGFVFQHNDQIALHEENESLRQQIVQLQTDNESFSNRVAAASSPAPLSNDSVNELLSLRGEVTRLKRDNEAVKLAAQASQTDARQALSKVVPVRTFVSTTFTDISWNEAIVTGGWKTPSGKRVVVFATVEPGQDANQLTIHSRVLEFPDATGQKLGLDQYNIDGQTSPKANKLTAEQYAAISTASQNSDDVEVLAAPSVGTASGRQAEIQIVDTHQTASGEEYSTGPVIDFIPTISADGKSVQLVMVAQLNFSTGLPSNH